MARAKRAAHSGTLAAPAPEPGTLHVDLKELVLSVGNYRWVVFAIDEFSRYVFVDFIKSKSDADAAVARIRVSYQFWLQRFVAAAPVHSLASSLAVPGTERCTSGLVRQCRTWRRRPLR